MRWFKRDRWKIAIPLAGLLLLLLLMVLIPLSASAHGGMPGVPIAGTAQPMPTVDLTVTALSKEKLKEDVAQEQRTLDNWLWTNGATLLSVLVVVVGGLIGFLQWLANQQRWVADRRAEHEKGLAEQLHARELARDDQSETALQTYIDKMSELLLENHLHSSKPRDEVREIARVRTLTVLPQLDPTRKKSVLRFLYEADLILTKNTIVDLRYVKLQDADLHRATFNYINLNKSNLRYADLSESLLDQADLSGAKLEGANLNQASLVGANLNGILDFEQVKSMKDANLRGVTGLTKKQLEACKARGAIVDEETTTQSTEPPQNNNASTPPASASDGSTTASSQPSTET